MSSRRAAVIEIEARKGRARARRGSLRHGHRDNIRCRRRLRSPCRFPLQIADHRRLRNVYNISSVHVTAYQPSTEQSRIAHRSSDDKEAFATVSRSFPGGIRADQNAWPFVQELWSVTASLQPQGCSSSVSRTYTSGLVAGEHQKDSPTAKAAVRTTRFSRVSSSLGKRAVQGTTF
jgi:hypothetical protein